MHAAFQEAQFQSNTIENSLLYMDNLQPMEFFSSGVKYVQVNPDDALEVRKVSISFFRPQSNLNLYLPDKLTTKATMQILKLCLKLPYYILSIYKKTVELVG